MRLIQNERLTDPSVDEVVCKLTFISLPHQTLPFFQTGQCVRLHMPAYPELQSAYFAIASDPHDNATYEFVIKAVNELSTMLTQMVAGDEVEAEGPMGKGFDLSEHKGKNLILMGVGTGIAPLRSVWLDIIKNRSQFGNVTIYAGFLSAMHHLLTDELHSLDDHDIQVSISLTTGHDDWKGPVGFVQHALQDDAPSPENTVACLAGMNVMVDACTDTLLHLGFSQEQILLNY